MKNNINDDENRRKNDAKIYNAGSANLYKPTPYQLGKLEGEEFIVDLKLRNMPASSASCNLALVAMKNEGEPSEYRNNTKDLNDYYDGLSDGCSLGLIKHY